MLFTFKSLFLDCVHETKFTNAIHKSNPFQFTFFRMLNDYSYKSWNEIKKGSNHCHQVKEYDRERLGNYMKMNNQEIDNLVARDDIYQIAIEEDGAGRAYGILKKKFANHGLFDFLFIDPNHLFHHNQENSKFPSKEEARCIMREKNCDEFS